jgi:hypothetical protein
MLYTTQNMIAKYGTPTQAGTYLINTPVAFPLRLAWDLPVKVTKIRCHKLEAINVTAIFADILKEYGIERIRALGIDLFGGCFNFRQQRGGTDWSKHSWGTAIDLDPARNQLKWGKDKAVFAKPAYAPMIDIFERYGWKSLGREKNYDWMHFEAAP